MGLTGITVFGCEPDEAALFRELAPRLGVRARLVAAAAGPGNAGLAGGDRCVSVGHKTRVTGATLDALGRAGVRYLCTRSIGFNHIDVPHAHRAGIAVGNVAYSPDSVADFTLMLMLMAVRHARSLVLRAEAHDYRLHETRGRELRDLTVGVVGTGRIGSAVIERLGGFKCRVLANGGDPLDEVLRHSDIVTLHTPLTAGTHHLLDRERIGRMKPGAVLVNTGRGPLVDTEALVAALEDGRLGGAALDVVEGEEGVFYADRRGAPIAAKALLRLHQLPNVLISPHTAYYTDHALRDTVEQSIRNCLSFESGTRHD